MYPPASMSGAADTGWTQGVTLRGWEINAFLEERQRKGEDQKDRGHAQTIAYELPRRRDEAPGGEAAAQDREEHR